MSGKSQTKKTTQLVPDIALYLREADPGDPTSRPMFTPGRLSLDKSDGGMFKVRIPGMNNMLVTKELEAIFLVTYPESECRCTEKADTKTVVCRSYNRKYSTKGFKCNGECPYEELGVDKTLKKYKRPLRKRTFLLVREVGADKQFILVKYESTLNQIMKVDGVKNYFHGLLKASGGERPFPSNNIALIKADTEKVDKTISVAVIGNKPEIAALLSEEDAAAVAKISTALIKLNTDFMKGYEERTEALYAELVEKGLAGTTNIEKLAKTSESKESEETVTEGASDAGKEAGVATKETKKTVKKNETPDLPPYAADDAEAAEEAENILDPEEDDVPF